MSYYGGKEKWAPRIAALLQPEASRLGAYHEPFCGLASVLRRVACAERSGSDVHLSVVTLLRAVRDGWRPPPCDEALYRAARERRNRRDPLDGFLGHMCSFGGRYWGGLLQVRSFDGYTFDVFEQAARKVERMRGQLQGARFEVRDYRDWYATRPCVIYADPPYALTDEVGGGGSVDEGELATALLRWRDAGCEVFLSYPRDLGVGPAVMDEVARTAGFARGRREAVWRVQL